MTTQISKEASDAVDRICMDERISLYQPEKHSEAVHALRHIVQDAIDASRAQPDWIPVSGPKGRSPTKEDEDWTGHIIARFDDGSMGLTRYEDAELQGITDWQPTNLKRPEPPKK